MSRLVSRDVLAAALNAAGLADKDVDLVPLARAVKAHVDTLGVTGLDPTDATERAALVAAVGTADMARIQAAIALLRASDRLVLLP